MQQDYFEELKIDNAIKLRENISKLPSFTSEFFLSISTTTSILTRIGYAYDLKLFFEYLIKEEPAFYMEDIKIFTFEDFKKITATHIKEFIEYLTYYTKTTELNNKLQVTNDLMGKSRKLSAIRSIFWYFTQNEKIEHNPALLVKTPKIHEKNIVFLDVNEVANLLDEIDSGDNLTEKQKYYHAKTRKRDIALVMTLLGTGMRISECIGLDIDKIDFDNNALSIIRKGGKESYVYFNDEVREVLLIYIEERQADYFAKNQKADKSNDVLMKEFRTQPLFVSLQDKRIGAKTVQNLVKKYSQIAVPFKKISPHKLRSTYGTTLYNETRDIYLVADALGHADVNTTRKHYANMSDAQRRVAPKYITLRDKK